MSSGFMEMICIKLLPVVGSESCNLTIGKKYEVSVLPIPLNEGDEMKEPSDPRVMVWGDDINSDYIYPKEAFITVSEWREQQLNNIL